MGNPFGRSIIVPLTNHSGAGVALGDVVIADSTQDDSFITTTSAASTGTVGVAQQTIANGAVGLVLFYGYTSLINVNASVTRLHYGTTHTVAKQATDGGATRGAGTFCVFLKGGATPDAFLYGADLSGAALTNPMSAQDDMIIGGSSGVPARLAAAGAASKFLQTDGSNHVVWGNPPTSGPLASCSYNPVGQTNTSTTSTTLAAIDTTNLTTTFTAPASGNVKVTLSSQALPNGAWMQWGLVDGGGTAVTGSQVQLGQGSNPERFTAVFLITGLTPSSSYTWRWAHCAPATGTVYTEYGGGAGQATMFIEAA